MTGPTPSFGSLDEVTRSLGDVTEHAAETRNGVKRRIVRFIVIYPLYLRRPGFRHSTLTTLHCGADATEKSMRALRAVCPNPLTQSCGARLDERRDRKSTRLNSSHEWSSY